MRSRRCAVRRGGGSCPAALIRSIETLSAAAPRTVRLRPCIRSTDGVTHRQMEGANEAKRSSCEYSKQAKVAGVYEVA
jgi:hypothetical protein